MKRSIATLSLATLMGLTAAAVAAEGHGVVHFTGEIIQGGCSAGSPDPVAAREPHQLFEVAPGVRVQVSRVENACAEHWPVSTQYVALATPSGQSPGGVVIVTYR